MEVKQKLYITDEAGEKFLGIGVLWLLKAIRKTGSIRQAAAGLELSYTKALRMLNGLEKNIGHPVLVRHKGGDSRSGAVVTPFGEKLIECYSSFQESVKADTERSFRRFLNDLRNWEDGNEEREI